MSHIKKWKRGDQTRLSEMVRRRGRPISRQRINDYIKGRRTPSPPVAELLVEQAALLGHDTALTDWLFPTRTDNPLFG